MRKRRVIVYEDEKVLQDFYTTFLTSLNYEVVVFPEPTICPLYSGKSDACTNIHPCADALITDFFMPRMNGVELIQAQAKRGCKLTPRNKALASGDIDKTLLQPILQLGCAYFQKPFPLSELVDWLAVCEKRIDIETPLGMQRREPRIPLIREVLCTVVQYAMPLRGICVNISDSGLCLKLPVYLQREESVGLPKDLPFPSGVGRVRWSAKQNDDLYLTGLQCM